MRGRIAIRLDAVAGGGDDLAARAIDQHGADRHLAALARLRALARGRGPSGPRVSPSSHAGDKSPSPPGGSRARPGLPRRGRSGVGCGPPRSPRALTRSRPPDDPDPAPARPAPCCSTAAWAASCGSAACRSSTRSGRRTRCGGARYGARGPSRLPRGRRRDHHHQQLRHHPQRARQGRHRAPVRRAEPHGGRLAEAGARGERPQGLGRRLAAAACAAATGPTSSAASPRSCRSTSEQARSAGALLRPLPLRDHVERARKRWPRRRRPPRPACRSG